MLTQSMPRPMLISQIPAFPSSEKPPKHSPNGRFGDSPTWLTLAMTCNDVIRHLFLLQNPDLPVLVGRETREFISIVKKTTTIHDHSFILSSCFGT